MAFIHWPGSSLEFRTAPATNLLSKRAFCMARFRTPARASWLSFSRSPASQALMTFSGFGFPITPSFLLKEIEKKLSYFPSQHCQLPFFHSGDETSLYPPSIAYLAPTVARRPDRDGGFAFQLPPSYLLDNRSRHGYPPVSVSRLQEQERVLQY
jgi:hypothetical protein